MRAKKSLGQHFLSNPRTAERIADAVGQDRQTIVEVGPGPGILTEYLARRAERLVLIEKDDDLASQLVERYAGNDHVSVINADFLRLDLSTLTSDPDTALVGNFPYNISSQIVFRMLEYKEFFSEMVGMFQLEMARRIVATPGSKEYGVISVLTQAFYSGAVLFHVGPGQFRPPPKVKSAVIRLERNADLDLPCNPKMLRAVVKTAFLQRRKMLRNTMKSFISDKEILADPLFSRRPEQLELEEFYSLTNLVEKFKDN